MQRHLDLDRECSVQLKPAEFDVETALGWGRGRRMFAQLQEVVELYAVWSLDHCQAAVALAVMKQQVEWEPQMVK